MNGRISDRSFRRYRKARFFFTAVLDNFDAVSMIRVQDGERIITMGANPVHVSVNGNCKFDQAASYALPTLEEEVRKIAGINLQERVLVAGSTHEGEEEAAIKAFLRIRQSDPEALLILDPRHIDRSDRVVRLLEGQGIRDWVRRSRLDGEGRKGSKVVLWDTFGELFKVYSLATLVFCEGSLVPKHVVMMDICKRLGILPKYYAALNAMVNMRYGGPMSDEYKLCEDGSKEHTWPDVVDRLLKDRFGPEHGLEYVRKKGVFTWPKRKEDVYWKWFKPSRVPVYFEYFIDAG